MDARTPSAPPFATRPDDLVAEAQAWVRRLQAGLATTDDAAEFQLWRARSPAHAQAWARAASDWRNLGVAARLHRARPQADRSTSRLPRRVFLGSALSAAGAAAVVAVVHPPLGLWPSWSELGADYRTATGEQKDIDVGPLHLALNTQTSVSLRAADGAAPQRVELLSGEALVRNRGESGLEVVAGPGRIRLGPGCIEVRHLGDRVRVVCTEGSAELQHPLRTLVLQASQQVTYGRDAGHDELGAVGDAGAPSAWREGVVVFRDTPLPEAVAEINRYRPGRVMLVGDQLAQRRISGRFRIAALDEALVQIQQLYDTRVHRVGGVVVLG